MPRVFCHGPAEPPAHVSAAPRPGCVTARGGLASPASRPGVPELPRRQLNPPPPPAFSGHRTSAEAEGCSHRLPSSPLPGRPHGVRALPAALRRTPGPRPAGAAAPPPRRGKVSLREKRIFSGQGCPAAGWRRRRRPGPPRALSPQAALGPAAAAAARGAGGGGRRSSGGDRPGGDPRAPLRPHGAGGRLPAPRLGGRGPAGRGWRR